MERPADGERHGLRVPDLGMADHLVEASGGRTEAVRPRGAPAGAASGDRTPGREARSEEHTSELQSQSNLVCRLLLEKKKNKMTSSFSHRRRFYVVHFSAIYIS